ncbi:MAG: hypothetical protein V1686_02485 [Patescibacteria group bacterium]
MKSYEYIARIFRAKPEIVKEMEEKMNKVTGKTGVLDKVVKENEFRISKTMSALNCHDYSAENVALSLITKLQKDDRAVCELFRNPDGASVEGYKTLFNFALELANTEPLFVLKEEIAKDILRKNPPPNIMKVLGYKDVDELLEKENLYEIFAAFRFVENNEWMHKAFDETYQKLIPDDFEERKTKLIVLSEKWLKIAEGFVKKKYHNVSHLKELGVVFVIPLKINTPGETLRVFSMVLHYLHETEFYSRLFRKASLSENFGKKVISLLKGEILEQPKNQEKMIWPIIQRYLAKDNPEDPYLFVPHVNPEALHWKKTEKDISDLGKRFENIDLELWYDLDWVGGFFKNNQGKEELVSFDLIDNWMGLVNKEQSLKYLYHHQEALWNEIFSEYMGPENLEKLMVDNFDKGFIEL